MSSVNSMRTEVTEYDRISLCNGYFFAALASVGWSRCGDTKQLIYRSTNEDWWSTLLNKAYDLWNTGITSGCSDSVDACDGAGNPALICQRLVGGNIVYKHHNETSVGELTGFIRRNCRGEFSINPMVAWTHSVAPKDCEYIAKCVVPSHAYSVLGLAYANGENYVVLRNPWGMYEAKTDTLMGCWCPYQHSHLRVQLNRNGVFAMRISNFKKYFCGCAAVNQGCI